MRLWYLSHRRPAKAQASLRVRAVSPEPSLFAHIKYGSRRRVRPKIRHLAPLDVCTCAFEEWIYGGQTVSKSHALAYLEFPTSARFYRLQLYSVFLYLRFWIMCQNACYFWQVYFSYIRYNRIWQVRITNMLSYLNPISILFCLLIVTKRRGKVARTGAIFTFYAVQEFYSTDCWELIETSVTDLMSFVLCRFYTVCIANAHSFNWIIHSVWPSST